MAVVERVVHPLRLALNFGVLAEPPLHDDDCQLTHPDAIVELVGNR